jgi:NADPH-dependent 7-cyano-7-deazaguanine reductase QueF
MKPIEWLEDATPEEIGEALLAVSETKALKVVVYLVSRTGYEIDALMRDATERIGRDPIKAVRNLLGKR